MEWINLEHSLLEWALFTAAILALVAIKLYARQKRREFEQAEPKQPVLETTDGSPEV